MHLVPREDFPVRLESEVVPLRWEQRRRDLDGWRLETSVRGCTPNGDSEDATLDPEIDGERVAACFEDFSGGLFEKRGVAQTADHTAELWVLPFRNSTAMLRVTQKKGEKQSAWSGWAHVALRPKLSTTKLGLFEVTFRDFEGRRKVLVVDPRESSARVLARPEERVR
jgi:hypothetical protein